MGWWCQPSFGTSAAAGELPRVDPVRNLHRPTSVSLADRARVAGEVAVYESVLSHRPLGEHAPEVAIMVDHRHHVGAAHAATAFRYGFVRASSRSMFSVTAFTRSRCLPRQLV